MNQYIEVTVKLAIEVDAVLEKETLKSELERDVMHVMRRAHITLAPYQRKNVLDGVLPDRTEILSLREEAELFGNDESKYRYYLFGQQVTDMYESNRPLGEIKDELSNGGAVFLWDGVDVNDLLSAVDGWLSFQEISEAEYEVLKESSL